MSEVDDAEAEWPTCEWCCSPIEPGDETVDREATMVIGKMVPLHVDCAEEFDHD